MENKYESIQLDLGVLPLPPYRRNQPAVSLCGCIKLAKRWLEITKAKVKNPILLFPPFLRTVFHPFDDKPFNVLKGEKQTYFKKGEKLETI